MGKVAVTRRQRGTIRRRGNSLQVVVHTGVGPLTGRRMCLMESSGVPVPALPSWLISRCGTRSPR